MELDLASGMVTFCFIHWFAGTSYSHHISCHVNTLPLTSTKNSFEVRQNHVYIYLICNVNVL